MALTGEAGVGYVSTAVWTAVLIVLSGGQLQYAQHWTFQSSVNKITIHRYAVHSCLHFVSNTNMYGRKQSFLHQYFKLWKFYGFTIPRTL